MNTSLIIFVSALALGAAQMTFSDGWEKRQPSRPYAHHYAHQKSETAAVAEDEGKTVEEPVKNTPVTPITNCMEEYMAGVREMHAAMMMLYSRFQTCEDALANPLLPSAKEKTSPARF